MNSCLRIFRTALCWLTLGIFPTFGQNLPPPGTLAKIADQLPKTSASHFRFGDAYQPIDSVCKMQTFNVTLWRDAGGQHTFSMMSDPVVSDPAHTNILAVTSKFEADADGSARAYSPEDPAGQASCSLVQDSQGRYVRSGGGQCALDTFQDGGIYVFDGATRIRDSNLGENWRKFWSLIRNHNLRPFDFSALLARPALDHYYLFYWQDQNMIVVFNKGNIPRTSSGYPCFRSGNSRFPGYFISATTLQNEQDELGAEIGNAASIAPPECKPLRNIDSESVPYFVIPRGRIGGASIGDVVVSRIRSEAATPLVYGVIADAGPIAKIGEGSIAFNQKLKNKSGPVMNNKELNRLAIDDGSIIGILMLGGTKKLLNGNYSRQNIEKVARAQFARWSGGVSDPTIRLKACFEKAAIN
jgi:hypothetical protein